MAVDESSSQDSTLIDDDLVAALGFEPVTTSESPVDDVVSAVAANSDGESTVLDEEIVDDTVVRDELGSNGELNGFGIDQIDAADGEALVGDLADAGLDVDLEVADDLVDLDAATQDRGSFFDLDSEIDADSSADDSIDSLDVSALDIDARDDFPDATDDMIESDLASVPSIADPDLDTDATAPVGLVDLEADHVDDAEELGGLDAVDDAEVSVFDASVLDESVLDESVIDLDSVDLSDSAVLDDELAGPTHGFADADVQELADADSVFADATPLLDPPVFDEPATETIGRVEAGMLDLDIAEETVGTAAVATTAADTPNRRRRRLRARKSRRVIRHIDPWSVLTFSVIFHMVVFAALLLSSVLVWNAAIASGMVENVESFIQELGDYETFEINADVMFRAAIVIAGMLTLASSVLVVLLTVVFNLISDLVGGIRVTVIEEETVRVPIEKKRGKARNE